MKTIIIIFALMVGYAAQAQQFVAKTGKAHFLSKTSMEDIEGTSNTAVCALNTGNKKMAAILKRKAARS